MKKIYLILLLTLFCGVKGYCQLMQSNSIAPTTKRLNTDSISYLQRVSNTSASIIKNDTLLKYSKNVVQNLQYQKGISDTINKQNDSIRKLQITLINTDDKVLSKALNAKISALQASNNALSKKQAKLEDDIAKSVAERANMSDKINDLTIELYSLYVTAINKELANYEKQIGENTSKALKGFDTVALTADPKNQHLIDSISNVMNLRCYIVNQKLESIKSKRDSVSKYFEELKQTQKDAEKYKVIKSDILLNAAKTIDLLVSSKKDFDKNYKTFNSEYEIYLTQTNANIAELKKVSDKMQQDNMKQATEEESLSALGGISNIFGEQGALVHNVSILAQRKFAGDAGTSFFGDVKLFAAGGADSDRKKTGVNALFVPEVSTYGFMTDFVFGFIPSQSSSKRNRITGKVEYKLGLILGCYYLGKKLQPDTLTAFSTSVFHLKLGMQYIIIPNVLSIYAHTNQLLVATNNEEFGKYYTDVDRIRSFTSIGVESYLELKKKSEFYLSFNLGFVLVNKDVNGWLKSNDSVIPNVKLSLVKNFSW